MIRLRRVVKVYKKQRVLDDVSVDFRDGMIHGLIGRNGSGKTVLLKCIAGLVPVTSGTIFLGKLVLGKDLETPQSLGAIIETPGFLPSYTGYQNLRFLASIRNRIGRDEIERAMARVGLDPADKKWVGNYSLGMRQRLGIAQAIMENPKLLILDEPMNGLDNDGVRHMRRLLANLREEGKTILLASHDPADVDVLCDTVCEMHRGRLELLD